ncbi:rare lipoprotein A [Blastomonas natatoria]|uniref:Endolytic peptidoglycan transglycosylase RlpA n=1 Tax=Blastomonas natatoria TaxID=34015 RepID=A0A2V3VF71_9SPHN|nr:septal ring lytic transglycosylase RlpA family protein [Blastomonas natatoria]PXW75279.1 rare lipoprotein A [Blastomonas natatoria]
MGITLTLALAGCGGGGSVSRSLETAPPKLAGGVTDYPVKLGEPYQLGGITYTPTDVFNYDETGYASWYGRELDGKSTANGETFIPDAISGAHRTLPLPSYVEVTALDSGKTILVRLNDRGPASPDRLIDLSQGAARQLGVLGQGAFAVRVRRVNPPEAERAKLRQGQAVAARMDTPESLLVPLRRKLDGKPRPAGLAAAPAPESTPSPTPTVPAASADPNPKVGAAAASSPKPASGNRAKLPPPTPRTQGSGGFIVEGDGGRPRMAENGTGDNRATLNPAPAKPDTPAPPAKAETGSYFVQVAAFSSKGRADELAKRIGAKTVVSDDGKIFRVRYGPYADANAAQQGVTLAKRKGYQGVQIQQDPGR